MPRNMHCEIAEEDEPETRGNRAAGRRRYPALRRFGHAKNGRDDVPQVVVGLAVTRDGLPVRCWIFPGNTVDVTTVEQVKADLRGWQLGRCVFVGDAGMVSAKNLEHMAAGGGRYLVGTRLKAGDEVTTAVINRPGRYRSVRETLRVKEVWVPQREAGHALWWAAPLAPRTPRPRGAENAGTKNAALSAPAGRARGMGVGTGPLGSAGRCGRGRRGTPGSAAGQAAGAARPGGGSAPSPSAARSRRTA
jgi:Transposase DDE domain